jgi:hypothetical protein
MASRIASSLLELHGHNSWVEQRVDGAGGVTTFVHVFGGMGADRKAVNRHLTANVSSLIALETSAVDQLATSVNASGSASPLRSSTAPVFQRQAMLSAPPPRYHAALAVRPLGNTPSSPESPQHLAKTVSASGLLAFSSASAFESGTYGDDSSAGCAFVHGGSSGTEEKTLHEDLWFYNKNSGGAATWVEVNAVGRGPGPRSAHAMAFDGTGAWLLIAGGVSPDGDLPSHVNVLCMATSVWREVDGHHIAPRTLFTMLSQVHGCVARVRDTQTALRAQHQAREELQVAITAAADEGSAPASPHDVTMRLRPIESFRRANIAPPPIEKSSAQLKVEALRQEVAAAQARYESSFRQYVRTLPLPVMMHGASYAANGISAVAFAAQRKLPQASFVGVPLADTSSADLSVNALLPRRHAATVALCEGRFAIILGGGHVATSGCAVVPQHPLAAPNSRTTHRRRDSEVLQPSTGSDDDLSTCVVDLWSGMVHRRPSTQPPDPAESVLHYLESASSAVIFSDRGCSLIFVTGGRDRRDGTVSGGVYLVRVHYDADCSGNTAPTAEDVTAVHVFVPSIPLATHGISPERSFGGSLGKSVSNTAKASPRPPIPPVPVYSTVYSHADARWLAKEMLVARPAHSMTFEEFEACTAVIDNASERFRLLQQRLRATNPDGAKQDKRRRDVGNLQAALYCRRPVHYSDGVRDGAETRGARCWRIGTLGRTTGMCRRRCHATSRTSSMPICRYSTAEPSPTGATRRYYSRR